MAWSQVFEEVGRLRSRGCEVSLNLSALEIYNEQMRDLLLPPCPSQPLGATHPAAR